MTSSIPNSPDNFHDGPTTLSEDRLGFLKDAFIIKLENIRNSMKLFRANIFQTLKHFFRILESSASTLSEEIHISTTVLRKCFRILRHETCRYYRLQPSAIRWTKSDWIERVDRFYGRFYVGSPVRQADFCEKAEIEDSGRRFQLRLFRRFASRKILGLLHSN